MLVVLCIPPLSIGKRTEYNIPYARPMMVVDHRVDHTVSGVVRGMPSRPDRLAYVLVIFRKFCPCF
jgi:hypothetical protein